MRLLESRLLSDRHLSRIAPPPIVWVDASQITGLADTDPVPSWTNLAPGSSETFSQASGANQPTYHTNVQNGLPAVRFSGVGQHLDGSVAQTLKPVTVFAVIMWTGGNGAFLVGNTTGNAALISRVISSKFNLNAEGVADFATSTSNVPNGTASMWDYSYSLPGDYQFGFNGVDDGNGNVNVAIGPAPICLGARDSSSLYWTGDMYEIIIYNEVVTPAVRAQVQRHLIAKWGV